MGKKQRHVSSKRTSCRRRKNQRQFWSPHLPCFELWRKTRNSVCCEKNCGRKSKTGRYNRRIFGKIFTDRRYAGPRYYYPHIRRNATLWLFTMARGVQRTLFYTCHVAGLFQRRIFENS